MRFLVFLLFLWHWRGTTLAQKCECDKLTTNTTTACSYEVHLNDSIKSSTCTCIENSYLWQLNTTTNVISCYNPNPETCIDNTPNDGVCDNEQNTRCTATVLSGTQRTITKYFLYFMSVWIILWCVVTIVVNIMHRNHGHHRYIHFYEELVIILLVIVIGILNASFASKRNFCKIIAILSHFFMALVCAAFFMEANFAKSMVHGRSKKDGSLPAPLNYILPILIALIPTLVAYFTLKKYYGLSYQFCFSTAPGDMFWAFVIPIWILVFLAGFQAQLSCLACDKTTPEQDQKQCFWAKRSAKSLLMFSLLLFTLWLMVLFAGNEQTFYLFILAALLALLTGPTIFVVHTFCHLNTCQKWGKPGCFGSLYMLCPEKPKEEKCDDDQDDLTPQEPTPIKEESPPPPLPNKVAPLIEETPPEPTKKYPPVHTEASHFYSWLTALDNNARRSSEVLFRPKIA